MKKILLILFILSGFAYLNASAVIVCDIKAEVTLIYPNNEVNNVKLLVHSAIFSGGHSAGKDCPIVKGQEVEVKLENIKSLNRKKVYDFKFTRVFNFTNEGKGVVHNIWELK